MGPVLRRSWRLITVSRNCPVRLLSPEVGPSMLQRGLVAVFLIGLLAIAGPIAALAATLGVPDRAPAVAAPVRSAMTLAFEELWEPRTAETGVYGIVTQQPMVQTPDGSDPQLPWASNKITGRWGTLRGSDGTIAGIGIDVTGMEPNRWWHINGGRLAFHANPETSPQGDGVGGWALISKQTFPRTGRIAVEADLTVTAAGPGGFAGLALITGEGDYREISIRYENSKFVVKRNTPLRETVLAKLSKRTSTLRIEYDPATGFRYLVNKRLVGVEAIDHEGASFVADPSVGLYFTGEGGVPAGGSFVEGFVGPVRVWTADESTASRPAVASLQHLQR